MKKFFLGTAILGIYAIYSLGIRHQTLVIGKPAALSSSSQSSGSTASMPSSSSNSSSPPSSSSSSSRQYKDGTYTGSEADAYYGTVQVAVTVQSGKITSVKFLKYPNTHSTSVMINQQAMPYLQQETIQAQNPNNVQIISGATFTSQAFIQSLQAALSQA